MTAFAVSKRYECRWRVLEESETGATPTHNWVDHRPNEAHWPESAVMRWDLRQNDWHTIWPELVDHPCALLFAPLHPLRLGAPRFRDWVASWPDGFDWKQEIPEHLHANVSRAKKELLEPMAIQKGNSFQPGEDFVNPSSVAAAVNAENVLEQLAVILLDVSDELRPKIGQHLATLAMAPDSSRTIQALKQSFNEQQRPSGR